MRGLHSIPFIFGVTGHRDLRDEDIEKLEESVRSLFVEYQSDYPHTELIVISALAEGADMLVARVAKGLGVTLHVLLPYQEEEYLNSFMDKEGNIDEFNILKAYASKVEVNSCVDTYGHETCYQQLGERIADMANILLALWDGVDNGKSGGTSAIVKYQRTGFKENRFDASDGNALLIITTPRVSNPDVETDFSLNVECLGKHVKSEEFDKMLQKVDSLNEQTEVDDLLDGSLLKTYTKQFDGVAKKNQTNFKKSSLLILILSFLAFGFLEAMHVLHIDIFVIGYMGPLAVAFWWYHDKMRDGKVQDDFVYSRGLAEALRVQNAWNHAGLGKNVAGTYLKNYHHKFTWMKFILKNLTYLDKEPYQPYDKECNIEVWIDGQIEFFEDRIEQKEASLHKWHKIDKSLYKLGAVVLAVMGVLAITQLSFFPEAGLLKSVWHILVLVSGLLLLGAAFIGEKYLKIEGFEEEIYNYEISLSNFIDAKREIEGVEENSEEYRSLIKDLGLKALEENSKWVVLHDSMRVKPSLD